MPTHSAATPHAIHYQVEAFDPKAHLLSIKLTIQHPTQPQQRIALPKWIPGSYLIRDFAKHLVGLKAYDLDGNPVELTPEGLSAWRFSAKQAVTIEYKVYAWDLSVRKAHFDQTHAFFNGTSVFLAVEAQRDQAVSVELVNNSFTQSQQWKAATGMPIMDVNTKGFGLYQAENYQDLIEYPFELGNFVEINFDAGGIPHRMVFTGLIEANCDFERIKTDVQQICETQINFFGQAPMDNYLFQTMVTGSDYGGLEHRNSTALICSRNDLPYFGMEKATEGYLQFLELCSHEYFHTWNVKRILPLVYQQTDLLEPALTHQLWWFEGVTSYYDALFLLRSRRIDETTYLDLLGKQLTRVYQMPGRFEQSVADSSWYTWTKFYQQDEDAPNSIISYYTKGSVIALALDLTLRQQTQNQASLDSVLLTLWQAYGSQGIGLPEKRIETLCSEICEKHGGANLTPFFEQLLYQTEDVDFTALFADFGFEFILRAATSPSDMGGNVSIDNSEKGEISSKRFGLGARLQASTQASIKVTHVWNQQAAYHAGLSAGDEIIAINGIRVTDPSQINQMLQRFQQGQSWQCHFFRRDELMQCPLTPLELSQDRVTIRAIKSQSTDKGTLKWL